MSEGHNNAKVREIQLRLARIEAEIKALALCGAAFIGDGDAWVKYEHRAFPLENERARLTRELWALRPDLVPYSPFFITPEFIGLKPYDDGQASSDSDSVSDGQSYPTAGTC